jgi:phage-related protein
MEGAEMKDVEWVGSSLDDLKAFPNDVQGDVGFALYQAQCGGRHPDAKPLKGFGGATTLEIVTNYDSDAYRTVYTVRLETAVYVLHAFQKKSTRGIATPRRDMDLIRARLAEAMAMDAERTARQR